MSDDLKELIELKKAKQSLADTEQFKKTEENEVIPMTFKQKWDNYWYHYKFVTFLVAFVVVALLLFAKDMIFKPKYDLTLNIASKYSFSAVNDDIAETIKPYISDYDSNGKISVMVSEMQTNYDGTSTNPVAATTGEQKILAILNAGADALFIFDDMTYNVLIGSNDDESIFYDFSADYPDNPYVSGDKILIKETELGKKLRMNTVKNEIYLCVRKFGGTFKETDKNIETQVYALDFVENILG